MEIDVKQSTQKSKRRKRAQRMQAERGKEVVGGGEDSGEEDYGSLKRDKTVRPPVRRKRNKDTSPILEEDIIDGFAILSFKTYEDLEFAVKVASKRNEKRLSSINELTKLMADENSSDILSKSQKSNSATESKPIVRDVEAGKISNYLNQNAYCQDAGTSDDSGRASERLTTSSVAQRDAESSRDRLSDASSRCSSGKGYICDSEGDDDKVSDAGSGFSNTHPFTAKSSKPNSTSPIVEHASTNSNNSESIITKTDLIIDQRVVTELPPPALPSPITSIQTNKQNQNLQVPSRIDEKNTSDRIELKNTQCTALMDSLGSVKTEEANEDPKELKEEGNDSTLNTETRKEKQNINSDTLLEKCEIETFGTIKGIKNDPAVTDAGSSSFLYRSPYAQTSTGFPNYPYPVPPIESKELLPTTLSSKTTIPPLAIPTGPKDAMQTNKIDKSSTSFSINPPKERDNFSDIDSLSVSSVSSSSTAVIQSIPSSKNTGITFPRPMPTSTWPISTTQTDVQSVKTSLSISGAKSTPPPSSLNASSATTTTFATPLPPPTTTAPLSFSAESLFSTKPKDQTDLLRRELDSRFLDRAGLTNSSNNPPFLRQELHHHQHQHTHLHQHHQQIIPAVNPAPNTLFSAPLFKDIPKIGGVDSPFYRTGISMPMYTAYPPSLLHPSIGATTTQFIPQNSLSTFIPKKTGRWNAMHVRIAWEIYSHQTKQNPEKTNPLKATEVLRNPSHLHSSAPGGLLRAHDMIQGSYGPPHLITGRNIFDSSMNPQFLSSSSHLGMSPFSRYNAPFPPSPFASMSSFSRDSALGPPFTGLHDPWRSLQRPYLPSPAPPNWAMKPDVSNIEISKRESEERERQLRDREERERLRREREEKERQQTRDREREEKLKKEERERKEKEKKELERREMERERMLQQQRMNEIKPNIQNNVICHDRSPLRNGCDTDIRIKEESRKDDDMLRNDSSRFSSSSNPIMGTPSHAYLTSRHPQHVLGVSPSHLSRSILPHPGTSLSHFPPPPVWSGVDPYRDPYRLDPMTPLRYNPLMEAMRVEEERAKAMYAAHSALHYRPKDPASFPILHHRMPSTPLSSMKPNGPPHIPQVNSDTLKKDESSQNR